MNERCTALAKKTGKRCKNRIRATYRDAHRKLCKMHLDCWEYGYGIRRVKEPDIVNVRRVL